MHNLREELPPCELRAAGRVHVRRYGTLLPGPRRGLQRWLCAASFVATLLLAKLTLAGSGCGERPQDEIWLVSSRHVPCLGSGDVPHLRTQRYDSQTGWQPADVAQIFQPSKSDQILVIYVHGNRVESSQAGSEGRFVYRLITAQIEDPVSIRFVIWSWPSAQIHGQLRDVRVKAERTEMGGYCLGWFLAQLPPEQRVSLLSYSFGARIASGALHLLEGGQLSGRVLPPPRSPAVHTRMVMLAAALHRAWLRPGGYHELAFSHIDYLLNLYNCCDPVLKRYPFLYKGSRAQAMGFAGMYSMDLGSTAELIEQHSFCLRSHAAIHYLRNGQFLRRTQEVLFWHPIQTSASLAETARPVTVGH